MPPTQSVFQTPQFFEVLKHSKDFIPFTVQATASEEIGYVQGYLTHDNNKVKQFFTRRAIINGNPDIKDLSVTLLDKMLVKLVRELRSKAVYIEFRNLSDESHNRKIYEKQGFEYEDHLNILVDLTKSVDNLWKDVNSKRRNEIRRATKEGTKFEVMDDVESLRECYEILTEVYSRAKLPLFKLDFFENLFKYLNSEAKLHIFTAQYDGKIIGCMLALGYKGVLYDYYAGAKSEFYRKYPNDLIPWEVFLWGKQNGYHTFDFGGAGKPGVPYKVRDYKKQFGGQLVNYGRFKLILNKPLYKIGEMGVKLMKKYG